MKIELGWIDFLTFAPAIALFLFSLVPITIKVFNGNRDPHPTAVFSAGAIGLIVALGLALTTLFGLEKVFTFEKALVFDVMSAWAALLILGVGIVSLAYSRENLGTNDAQFSEYIFLFLNTVMGMLVVAWSNDLIITFIGIEIMSLCLYLMIGMSAEQVLSKEASFKYFVLGSFASAIFLYGIALIFGATGSSKMDVIGGHIGEIINALTQAGTNTMAHLPKNWLILPGTAMVIVGLGFKVAMVPFHAWAPDVYEGAPTPVTALMSTGVKVSVLTLFLRWIMTSAPVFWWMDNFLVILQWLAVLTMIVGNFAAILQTRVKRMLAYSGISHSGYAIVGLIAAANGEDGYWGASGVGYYLLAYSLMTVGAFGIVSFLEKSEDSVIEIDDLKGLGRKSPWLALCFSIFLVSLAGIPPTVGFFGKFFVFTAAINQGLIWLAVWGVLNSVVSVYYYLRPLVAMYMEKPEDQELELEPKRLTQLSIVLTAVLVVGLGVFSDPIYRFIFTNFLNMFS